MDPLLKVENLTEIHGPGCSDCLNQTGPEFGRNRYPKCGSIVACANITFEVMSGEILGVVGESGSGKSTIVQCLYFDLDPTNGEAYMDSYRQANVLLASNQDKRLLRNFNLVMVCQNSQRDLYLDISSGGNIAEKLLAASWRHVGIIRGQASNLLERTEVPLDRMDEVPCLFVGRKNKGAWHNGFQLGLPDTFPKTRHQVIALRPPFGN